MKKIVLIALVFAACNGNSYKKAEDAQDAGREFIRASLDGDHKKARFYMFQDTTNLFLLKQQEVDYNVLDSRQKTLHRESSIRPVEIKAVNDSVTLYRYYNTYNSKDTTTIRIIKTDDTWLVDLKSIIKM
jgi:hypothetical protein